MSPDARDIQIMLEHECHQQRDGLGLLVEVACGPFISEDFVGWENSLPMHAFLEEAKKSKADALVLCGPFLDEKNKALDTLKRTYVEEFLDFLNELRAHLEEKKMINDNNLCSKCTRHISSAELSSRRFR